MGAFFVWEEQKRQERGFKGPKGFKDLKDLKDLKKRRWTLVQGDSIHQNHYPPKLGGVAESRGGLSIASQQTPPPNGTSPNLGEEQSEGTGIKKDTRE